MELSLVSQNIHKIIELNASEQHTFKSLVEVISVNRNEILLREGQRCSYEYFVLKGCLRSFYIDAENHEHTTLFATEGWWTGNLKSFVRNTPSEFYVQALENTMVMRIPKKHMEALYAKIPKLERYFRILLQNRLLATQDRVSKHLSASASTRYLQFVHKYPNLEQRVASKHIASYLGMTPTYLSRLRKKRLLGNL